MGKNKKKVDDEETTEEETEEKVVAPKEEKVVKNFAVVYAGVLGKKAVSKEEAETIAKEYIEAGKCKHADVVEFIGKVE